MYYPIKIKRSAWAVTTICLLTAFVNTINAQQIKTKTAFSERIKTLLHTQDNQNSDSIFNLLRREARSLKEDSLYVELTLQQIEKNQTSTNVFQISRILEEFMIEEYKFLKANPRILIFCYLHMSKFYLPKNNAAKASIGISKYYFNRYLELLKTTL